MATAGRPRHDGPRTASGALSRAASAYQNDRPGIVMRMRRYKLGFEDAREPRAGEALGRLVLAGELGADLELVALWYRGIVGNYRRAIQAPDGLRKSEGRRMRLEVTRNYLDWAGEAVAAHEAMTAWLERAQAADRRHRLAVALHVIVLEDQDAPALVGDLKAALLALAPFFLTRIGGKPT